MLAGLIALMLGMSSIDDGRTPAKSTISSRAEQNPSPYEMRETSPGTFDEISVSGPFKVRKRLYLEDDSFFKITNYEAVLRDGGSIASMVDLSRLSGVAGRPLAGAAELAVSGTGSPITGAFDLDATEGFRRLHARDDLPGGEGAAAEEVAALLVVGLAGGRIGGQRRGRKGQQA